MHRSGFGGTGGASAGLLPAVAGKASVPLIIPMCRVRSNESPAMLLYLTGGCGLWKLGYGGSFGLGSGFLASSAIITSTAFSS